ncbi:hypothetical protein N7447_003449 [Penicillium robsamsonii]|uniref:uncharacterized protein n=1 Tax=Penicillium robsamsonii TaxID=1792511 RepID=UPI002548BF56|nr:uncharacterized protein N7447_003449 [Penicillium robsamsonii]KAJ5826686.1 hypothetical protein N7447_003449 [Penicillium robsamsonii]
MDLSMEYLTDLKGTQVTFNAVTEPLFNFPAQAWIIFKKLDEESNRLTKEDSAAGLGPSDTSGKFLCRPATGTEPKKAAIRVSQAVDTPPDHLELIAFRTFIKLDYNVIPRLLGY